MLFRTTGLFTALIFTFSMTGCDDAELPDSPVIDLEHGEDDGHGEHDEGEHKHPETFAAAYAQLTGLRDTVKNAFDAKDSEAAHGPLHDVGHLLEEVSELGSNSELPDDAKQIIETNVEKLLTAFGEVDKKMHDAESGKDYSEVSEEIDAAIKAIADAAGELTEEHAHHDEDGEGHGDHGDHKDGDHKDGDHKDGDHKDGDHKDGDHKDGDHKDGDHKDGDHKDGDDADGDKVSKSADDDEAKKPVESDDKE